MRKPLVGAAAVIIIAGLAYTAAWFYGANQLKHAVEDWKQDAAAEGVAISYDEIRTGGYPLSLTAELVNLALRAEGKGVSFQSAPIRLRTTLWNPNYITYDFSGKYGLTVTEGMRSHMTISVESGTGEIRFNGNRREDHDTASNVRILNDKGIVSISRLDISGFTADKPAAAGDDTFHAEYDLAGLTVANPLGVQVFQPPIDHMRLNVGATGPFMDIFKNSTIVDWARAGGALTLRDASLEWNGFTFSLAGDGSLDAELRPSGKLTVTSEGFAETLESLEDSGVLPLYLGEYIRQITARFITPAGEGTKSKLLVAITAADGVLSVDGQPMAAVPSLNKL